MKAGSEMDRSKMLSGSELVAKGATKKVDGQLPEVGLKDVTPNGSWLEQKQIQSALEARKHLIAVERIEKSGSLSHAEWRDDLKLAEVTKQTGGHWQYIGHQAGKCLYLLPEEVLFLMETNSLLLKHNDVTVSLQKAYALCLSNMPIIQYKVYASLARLGYRVVRHKIPTPDNSEKQNPNEPSNAMENHLEIDQSLYTQETCSESSCVVNNSEIKTAGIEIDETEYEENGSSHATVKTTDIPETQGATENIVNRNGMILEDDIHDTEDMNRTINNTNTTKETLELVEKTRTLSEVTEHEAKTNCVVILPEMDIDDNGNETTVISNDNKNIASRSHGSEDNVPVSDKISHVTLARVYSIDESGVIRKFQKDIPETDTDGYFVTNAEASEDLRISSSLYHYQTELNYYDDKIKKLAERNSTCEHSNQSLDTMLDFHKLLEVNIKAPDEKYLPRNIFLHKTDYTLNIETIRTQNANNINDETDSLGSTTPANGMEGQRLTNMSHYSTFNSIRPRYPNYRHRPHYNNRMNFNYMYRGMQHFYTPRYHPNSFVRPHYMVFNANIPRPTSNNNQTNSAVFRKYHYDMIVNIAMRFRSGLALPAQVRALVNLVNTYNLRYNTRISLTPNFNIVGTPEIEPEPVQNANENVIRLDDEPKTKKQRLNNDTVNYNNNLAKLKELAAKLKMLHAKNLAVSRHRRVFSNAIKTFNKSFNADIYLDPNFVIVDRKTVVLDTSSDSDAVIVTEQEKPKKRKKLRNPFSILRRMGKDVNVGASTSQIPVLPTLTVNVMINDTTSTNNAKSLTTSDDSVEDLLICFYKSRFPGNDEFGGPKLCSRENAHLDTVLFQVDCKDVLRTSATEFKSWTDIKLAILKDVKGSLKLQKQQVEALSNDFFTTESQIQPILKPDCRDLKSALKQLTIIPTNKEVPAESSLSIHFDVCNRDVHFKKSNPPKPNFRVICYNESATFPSTQDVVALQGKYHDGVPIVFAFVGHSGAISYLQINSIELPVFIPDSGLSYE